MVDEIQKRIDDIKKHCGEHPQCYLFALLLSTKFGGTIYYDNNHCITKIGDKFYDRTGEYPIDKVTANNFLPLSEYYGISIEKGLMDSIIDTKGTHVTLT